MTTEICKSCGREKEMYSVLWCPYCDKPEVQKLDVLNLKKCLRYLELTSGDPEIGLRVWEHCIDNYEFNNDTFITLILNTTDVEIAKDLELIKKTWNIIEDNILVEISW